MLNPRIAPIEPPYPADVQADFDVLMRGAPPLLLFRTVARNPRVLQRMMAGGLLDRGSISLRSRELMILRTCARCGAQWTPAQVRSSVHGKATDDCWTVEDQLVIELADQLHDSSHVDDTTWAKLSAHFAPEQLVELVMLAGLYHAVSFMVNACGVQPETFAPAFPGAA